MNPLHYAVVVGINHYPELDPLVSAVGDAQRFAAWLESEDGGGVPADNMRLLTVSNAQIPAGVARADATPKKTEIHNALYELAQTCKAHVDEHPADWEKTRLYVYVSGHGLAPVSTEAALLMADAGPDWYGENFPCASFVGWYQEAQYFKELVFFADCCRYWVEEAPLATPPWTKVRGNSGRVIRVTGYATFFGDPAYEPPAEELEPADERRSYFTKALLEGLEGKAADEGSREIDSNTLATYVRARVMELTRGKRSPQEPQMAADPATPILFGKLSEPEAEEAKNVTVTIQIVTPYDGDVAVLDGYFQPVETRVASPDPWVIELPGPRMYQVHPLEPDGTVDPEAHNPFTDEGRFSVVGEDRSVEL
jgi:hypothetical protein